ncbi:MAG TPA: hypothetical protein PKA31_01470 [Candidatus Moranbacteria bacterium]|nr:hypothetical protein [Candidatus Moranbacteria bacterium]
MARRWRRKRTGKGKTQQENIAEKGHKKQETAQQEKLRPLEMFKGQRQMPRKDRAEKGGEWLDELVDEIASSMDAEVKRIVHTEESQSRRWNGFAKSIDIPKGE